MKSDINQQQTPDNEVARLREENADLKQWLNERYKALSEADEEIARLMEEIKRIKSAAQAVIDRWETPAWKDAEPTASVIYRLRDALAPAPEEPANQCRCNNPSIITSTHNGKTYDQCSKCGKKFKITMDEWYGGFSKIESTEVSKLKEMVMDAAKRGDELAAHWKERAEKAEAIIKQLHHLAGIIEGFQNPTK